MLARLQAAMLRLDVIVGSILAELSDIECRCQDLVDHDCLGMFSVDFLLDFECIVVDMKFDIVYKTMKDFGQLDFDERKILVSNKIKGEVLLDTVIHEAVHAMLSFSGLGYILEDVQTELEEALVRAFDNIAMPLIKEQIKLYYNV